jgi:hypothetical protein
MERKKEVLEKGNNNKKLAEEIPINKYSSLSLPLLRSRKGKERQQEGKGREESSRSLRSW